MATYTYLVTDLATGRIKDEIVLGSLEYETSLNSRGSLSGVLNRRAATTTRDNIREGRTGLYVIRDDLCVWGGYISRVQAASRGGLLRLGAVGFLDYLGHRYLREGRRYTGVDQATIMADLVKWLGGTAGPYNALGADGSGAGWGARTIPLNTSAPLTGVVRDRLYESAERPTIGKLLDDLTKVIDGPDHAILSVLGQDVAGTRTMTNTYTVWAKRGVTTDVVLEFGGNCDTYDVVYSAESLASHAEAMNDAEPETRLYGLADATTDLQWDMVETRSGVTETTTLYAWATALVQRFQDSLILPALEGNGYLLPPTTLADGDLCRARISDGYVQVDGTYRVVGRKVTVGGGGSERVAYGLALPEDTGVTT